MKLKVGIFRWRMCIIDRLYFVGEILVFCYLIRWVVYGDGS